MKHAPIVCLWILFSCASLAASTVVPQEGAHWPTGSERAVAAALEAEPGATVDDVARGKAIGLGGDGMVLWTIKLHGGTTIDVAGDGVPVHRSKPVRDIDLPTLVGNGKAKVAPQGAERVIKRETLGVVRYIAMRKPQTRYVVRVATAQGSKSVTVDAEGKVLRTTDASAAPKPAVQARSTEGPIPELAAKAVSAVREVYPDMMFELVEEVPYVDGSTQTIEMLWYEVEFSLAGVHYEITATPDGLVIEYHKPIPGSELPRKVAAAVAAELPDGKIEEAVKRETRGMPKFVALDRPAVVYDITPQGAASPIKLRMDGTEVKEPEWPEWVKKANKKSG